MSEISSITNQPLRLTSKAEIFLETISPAHPTPLTNETTTLHANMQKIEQGLEMMRAQEAQFIKAYNAVIPQE